MFYAASLYISNEAVYDITINNKTNKGKKMLEALKAQIEITTKRLERGEVQLSDRIFLNHILDELDFILNTTLDGMDFPLITGQMYTLAESTCQMLGSANELVEDGLE